MKILNVMPLILSFLLMAFIGGCGSGNGGNDFASSVAASQQCIDCHTSNSMSISPVTGGLIVDDWKRSAHNTSSGAACIDCHGRAHNHPNDCGQCHGGSSAITARFFNPDENRQCDVCHGFTSTIKPLSTPHFNNITSPAELESTGLQRNGYPASFITSQGIGKCRNCHNPHDPTTHLQRNVEWASSNHGNTKGEAWRHYDFKTRGTAGAVAATSAATDCVKCHTTTGYINYVTSNFTDIHPWGKTSDKTKEVLQCNACHDNSYNFARQRALGAITGYYNYSSKNTTKLLVSYNFPDVGKTNLCMVCHTGRESGLTLAAVAALDGKPATGPFVNYSTQSFVNSHYLTAGATIFGVSGYEYPSQNYSDPGFYAHKKLGVTLKALGSGPCVSCHMQKTGESQLKSSHRFKPELTDRTGLDCIGCHTSPGSFGIPTPLPNVISTEAQLETQKAGYNAALAVLASATRKRGIVFQSRNPYFFPSTSTAALPLTNWQTMKGTAPNDTGGYGAGSGPSVMGAAFNLNLFIHDPGGFAHNSTYAKRLIYDSIVLIATGQVVPVAPATITTIINDTIVIPPYTDLVATVAGTPFRLTPEMRNAAITWLTNGTGSRP